MIFKITNCDFGIKYDGQTYAFTHVVEVQIEDAERNRLTRGANAGDNLGFAYRDGVREPKMWTIPILNMSVELKEVLDELFLTQARVDCYCIDRATGSRKQASNAVLANRPQQLVLDETQDSMQVSLEFMTFDSIEVHK